MFLLVFGAAIAPHLILLIPTPHFVPLVPGQEPAPTVGAHTALHRIPPSPAQTPTATQACSEPPPPALGQTDRQTDSKAHPPPLIRLRSESTSSAPSMATSSCGERRKWLWEPLLCSIQALLLGQLQGWSVPSSSDKCHQSWHHLGAA